MKKYFDYVALGSRIRKIRKQNHMTQELAIYPPLILVILNAEQELHLSKR